MGLGTFLNGDMGYCDNLRGTSFDNIIFFLYKNLFLDLKYWKIIFFLNLILSKENFDLINLNLILGGCLMNYLGFSFKYRLGSIFFMVFACGKFGSLFC